MKAENGRLGTLVDKPQAAPAMGRRALFVWSIALWLMPLDRRSLFGGEA